MNTAAGINECNRLASELLQQGDAWFRLRSFNPAFPNEPREILLENSIHFGNIRSQDDSFEGDPHIDCQEVPPSYAEIRELARRRSVSRSFRAQRQEAQQIHRDLQNPEHFRRMRDAIIERNRALYHSSSILSFFRDPTMSKHWADYAGNGEGYGLLFDFTVPWIFEAGPDMGELPWVPFEVDYTAAGERPTIKIEMGPADRDRAFAELQRALLTKTGEWSVQGEERLIRIGIPAGHVTFPPESLRALILGPSVSDDRRTQLLNLVRKRDLPLAVFRAHPISSDLLAILLVADEGAKYQ